MAHLSGDRRLLDAFTTGADVCRATAAEVFAGGDAGAVRYEQRRSAKTTDFGLAREFGIERGEA